MYVGVRNITEGTTLNWSTKVIGLGPNHTVFLTDEDAAKLKSDCPNQVEVLDKAWSEAVIAEKTLLPYEPYEQPRIDGIVEPEATLEVSVVEPEAPAVEPEAPPAVEPEAPAVEPVVEPEATPDKAGKAK